MKLPDQVFGISTEDAYNRYLKKSKTDKKEPEKPATNMTTRFSLEDLTDFWRINGVNYRNQIGQVDLGKAVLPSKTQDKHASFSQDAISKGQLYVGNTQLYHSLFTILFQNKDNPQFKDKIEETRQFLQESMKNYWLMTLSRIKYTKSGKDLVIHNYGLQDKFEIQENIVGPDGYITQINPQNELKSILGSNDVNEINQVYNWITKKDLYLWRLNNKPKENDERVVRLGSDSDMAILYCDWDPDDSSRALAVRAQKF